MSIDVSLDSDSESECLRLGRFAIICFPDQFTARFLKKDVPEL